MYLGFRGWYFGFSWLCGCKRGGFLFVGVRSLSYIKRIVYKEGGEGNEYRTGFMKKVFSLCTCVDWGSDYSTYHPQGWCHLRFAEQAVLSMSGRKADVVGRTLLPAALAYETWELSSKFQAPRYGYLIITRVFKDDQLHNLPLVGPVVLNLHICSYHSIVVRSKRCTSH